MYIITDNPKLAIGIDKNPIVIPSNGPLTALTAVLPLQVRAHDDRIYSHPLLAAAAVITAVDVGDSIVGCINTNSMLRIRRSLCTLFVSLQYFFIDHLWCCLQLIAYELAVLKGFNPDVPRNLAKAVTTD